jgi:hypothetical protein
MSAMATPAPGAERLEPSAVTFDRLRWWVVGVMLGAAAIACISTGAGITESGSDTDAPAVQGPASPR